MDKETKSGESGENQYQAKSEKTSMKSEKRQSMAKNNRNNGAKIVIEKPA